MILDPFPTGRAEPSRQQFISLHNLTPPSDPLHLDRRIVGRLMQTGQSFAYMQGNHRTRKLTEPEEVPPRARRFLRLGHGLAR